MELSIESLRLSSDTSDRMWQDYGKKAGKKRKRSHAQTSGLVNPGHSNHTPSPQGKIIPFAPSLNMNRVEAQIQIDDGQSPLAAELGGASHPPEIIIARIVLSDLNPQGVVAFTEKKVRLGQKIKLTILDETPFYCKAHAIWVMEILTGTVISNEPAWPYRIGFEFLSESPEERSRIEEYCDRTSQEHPESDTG